MAISTYSYCDKLRICVTCDSILLENQAQLKSFIRGIEDGLLDLAKYYGVTAEYLRPDIALSKQNFNYKQYQFSDKLGIRRLSATRIKATG